MTLIKILFLSFFVFAGPSDFKKVLKEAQGLKYDQTKTYEEDQVLLFQESVVDVFFKKMIDDKTYTIRKNSEEFKQYIRVIGFLCMHSKDHSAGSYIAEIIEKTKMQPKEFWDLASKHLPGSVLEKLREDYKIEVKAPQG